MNPIGLEAWKPAIMNLAFNSPWSIIRPTVFRFLDKKYVDDFFKDGSLRLSSFERFSRHRDEQRKDDSEGKALASLDDGEMTAFYVSQFGHDCYVLCGSVSSSGEMSRAFGNSAIVIEDTTSFAATVAHALPGYRTGIEGLCNYHDGKLIRKRVEQGYLQKSLENHRLPDGRINMELARDIINNTAIEQLFLKEKKFAHQMEYRLLWMCSSIEEQIDIKVPDARQFCKRIDR